MNIENLVFQVPLRRRYNSRELMRETTLKKLPGKITEEDLNFNVKYIGDSVSIVFELDDNLNANVEYIEYNGEKYQKK